MLAAAPYAAGTVLVIGALAGGAVMRAVVHTIARELDNAISARHRRSSGSEEVRRTLLDVETPEEALALMRAVQKHSSSTDELVAALTRLYRRFEPRERSLRMLSMAHARLQGTGGAAEFAVCTVYFAMTLAICEDDRRGAPAPASPPSRASSCVRPSSERECRTRRRESGDATLRTVGVVEGDGP